MNRHGILRFLLSDPPGPRVAGVLVLLLLLGLYNLHVARALALDPSACRAHPVSCDGATLFLPLHRVAAVEGPATYTLLAPGDSTYTTVAGSSVLLRPGEILSVRGRFRAADGVVVEEARSAHPRRAAKERLGQVGAVLAVLGLPLAFRLRAGRLQVRG